MNDRDTVVPVRMRRLRWPQVAIARFISGRQIRSGILWGLVFGAYTALKAIGYVKAYPSQATRAIFASSLGNNVGIKVLLGTPHAINTISGYITWNMLGVLVIVGAIWALLTATKYFRGEEEAGRSELLLVGQTTSRRAAANILAGLGLGVLALYIVTALLFVLVGRYQGINYGTSAALFFALAVVASAALFMAIGALASQLMPTRARAATFTAIIFGGSFLLRAMADVTSARWLLDITPLGWIERMQPLYDSRPIWLLPIGIFILLLATCTMLLAGYRDIGTSIFADHDTRSPHVVLLNTPLGIAVRLTRASTIGWLVAISSIALLYGLLAKSAAQVLTNSLRNERIISTLTHSSQQAGANEFMGVIFLLQMLIIMAYAASMIAAIRKDEAEGYLDNLLVRKVGRLQWFWGRIFLAACTVLLAGVLNSIAAWAGEASQHTGLSFSSLLLAGINATAPALLVIGVGAVVMGFLPRLTAAAAYGVIGWSFLVEMANSGIHLNHWILDTSVLYHMALAPSVDPNWRIVIMFSILSFCLSSIGAWCFAHRDLAAE